MNASRWYVIDNKGMATLCASQEDAEAEVKDNDLVYPKNAPHRAVQLVEVVPGGPAFDDVLRMAREAGFSLLGPLRAAAAMRFATLVAAAERIKHADAIAMSECMTMFRRDMIKAEIIDPSAWPMAITEAILSAIQKERAAAIRARGAA